MICSSKEGGMLLTQYLMVESLLFIRAGAEEEKTGARAGQKWTGSATLDITETAYAALQIRIILATDKIGQLS